MGMASDPDSVVDSEGRVHGIKGLHVPNASVMPTVTSGDPNMPTAVISERIARSPLGRQRCWPNAPLCYPGYRLADRASSTCASSRRCARSWPICAGGTLPPGTARRHRHGRPGRASPAPIATARMRHAGTGRVRVLVG
jgi:GMC oxidoreductase